MNKKKKAQTRTSKNDQSSLNCASNERETHKEYKSMHQRSICFKGKKSQKVSGILYANTNLSIFSMK